MYKHNYAYLCYVLILFGLILVCMASQDTEEKFYSNTWVVRLAGGIREANRIAEKHGFRNLGQVGSLEGFYHFRHDAHPRRSRRSIDERTLRLSDEISIEFAEQQVIRKRVKRDFNPNLNDPLFRKQWYIRNTDSAFHDYDHNVLPVWKKGVTGKGVVVSILDDGIEYTHRDLAANYDKLASYDYNSNDADPFPRSTWNNENRHGTRCAGEVAAVANNSICGVGVAPGAKVGGVRMLDGDVTDAVEASSLSLQPQHIHIYSSSWGPDDDGRTVDGPAKLARKAFADGILHGRGGLGSIFVWASGNGGRQKDSCNCDGYTNSIYTLSISSATDHGTSPWYSEYCSSTLATTFSSGNWQQKKIVTTDLEGKCTESHTGTSASAPLAAGILALALEVNPKLTWRDMQHIVVRTSRTDKLTSDDFVTNAVGRKVSHKFGYGLLDAAALVDLAGRWKSVPSQHICHEIPDATQRKIPVTGTLKVRMSTKACFDTANFVRYLEHVEAVVSLKYSRRGDLALYLTSPTGTKATLLAKRPSDGSSQGFTNWPFMSTHTWEEDPRGNWTLEVENKGSSRNTGTVQNWSLVFYGTSQKPFEDVSEKEGVAACNLECDGECTGPSATDCKKCKHFRKETTKECVASCSSNEFAVADRKMCKLCSAACSTCNGTTNKNCLSCHPPLVLHQGACVNFCSQGWYKDKVGSESVCKKCDENCLSCAGTSTQCTGCKPSHQLVNTHCELKCSENEFIKENSCKPCHPSCLTCSGPATNACIKCGTRLSRKKNDSLFLHEGECKSTCPHYFYGDIDGHECKPCNKGCSTCAGPGEDKCLVCSHGLFRVGSPTGICVDKCPQGQYANLTHSVCEPCNSSCFSCENTNPKQCTACHDGKFLSKGKCVTDCRGRTYANKTLKECDNCYESCTKCNGKSQAQCNACIAGFHFYRSQCLLKCPSGTFPSETNTCLPCHADCQTCYGNKRSHCLSCRPSMLLYQSQCMTQCPEGTFNNSELQQCIDCDMTCATCNGTSSEHCTTCKDSWKLVGSACIQPCDKGGMYRDKDGCHECHSSCVSCVGSSKTDCTSCQGVKFLDTLTRVCSYECPSAYYGEEGSGVCRPCPPGCGKCHGPGDCKGCKEGLVLVKKTCRNHCPFGTYKTPTNTCEPCDKSCKECIASPAQCIKCKDHEMLSGQSCVTICPNGTFLKPSTKKCLACDVSCAECSGPKSSDCTKCKSSSVKVGSTCLSSCPLQYYYNAANEQCQPCDYYCHTCKGGNGRVNCTKCVEPFVLHQHYCVRVCPKDGWFHNRNQQQCVKCHSTCRRCVGPTEHDCISCSDRTAPLIGFSCKKKCPDETFHNFETGFCEKCHPTCKTCTDSGKRKCKECVEGLVFDAKSGQCSSMCPLAGQYSANGKCLSCKPICKSCNGPSEEDCLSCKESQFLLKQSCVTKCPKGQFGDLMKQRCVTCHPVCQTCNGSSSSSCTSCISSLYFQNFSCVLSCSPSHYLDEASRVCKPCGRNCPDGASQLRDRSIHDATQDNFIFFLEDPDKTGVTTFLVLSTIGSVLLFFLVFGILQLHSYRKYRKYRIVENGDSSENMTDDQKYLISDDPEEDDTLL